MKIVSAKEVSKEGRVVWGGSLSDCQQGVRDVRDGIGISGRADADEEVDEVKSRQDAHKRRWW